MNKSTLSEDPYRNQKIFGRFTSGNRNFESESGLSENQSLSSASED